MDRVMTRIALAAVRNHLRCSEARAFPLPYQFRGGVAPVDANFGIRGTRGAGYLSVRSVRQISWTKTLGQNLLDKNSWAKSLGQKSQPDSHFATGTFSSKNIGSEPSRPDASDSEEKIFRPPQRKS
jgi:hypothetical protein